MRFPPGLLEDFAIPFAAAAIIAASALLYFAHGNGTSKTAATAVTAERPTAP